MSYNSEKMSELQNRLFEKNCGEKKSDLKQSDIYLFHLYSEAEKKSCKL